MNNVYTTIQKEQWNWIDGIKENNAKKEGEGGGKLLLKMLYVT